MPNPITAAGDEARKAEIMRALEQHQGNVDKTAKALGITRMQVYRYATKWGLQAYIKALRQGGPPGAQAGDPEEPV